jgi:hypothetical protein
MRKRDQGNKKMRKREIKEVIEWERERSRKLENGKERDQGSKKTRKR